jgi:hypothetical protein
MDSFKKPFLISFLNKKSYKKKKRATKESHAYFPPYTFNNGYGILTNYG